MFWQPPVGKNFARSAAGNLSDISLYRTISDSNDSCRSVDICRVLTNEYGLHIANDVEEIKAQLSGATSASVAADAGVVGKDNAISNDVVVGNGSASSNPDRIITEINRLLEPIADVCSKLPARIKSYYAHLLLRIPKDLREKLTRDNDARKRKGLPTVEDKIDNTLTMAVAVYDRLNHIEYALRHKTPKLEQSGQIDVHGKSVRSGIIAWLKST